MFGLSDNTDNKYADTTQASASDAVPADPVPQATPNSPMPSASADPSLGMPPASSSGHSDSNAPAPSTYPSSADAQAAPGSIGDVSLENAYITNDPPIASKANDPSSSQPTAASLMKNSNEDELLKLKQQALQSLAPLVDHLDQDPEEKFKTTMMMIQASDNADLIPEAFEAANKITDEKARARALLDVVNEINYFTQHATASDTPEHPAE